LEIQHRRHPITYRLRVGATKSDIEKEQARLVVRLVEALEPFIALEAEGTSTEGFSAATPKIGEGLFFADGEALGVHRMEKQSFVMPFRGVAWLRVIPKAPRILSVELLRNNIGHFGAFGGPVGAFILENAYGVAMLEQAGATWNVDDLYNIFGPAKSGASMPTSCGRGNEAAATGYCRFRSKTSSSRDFVSI
jgi:hypothetical protein